MSKPLHSKRCTVHAIKLDGRGNAEVRVGCYSDFRNQVEYQRRRVKATSVRFRGLHIEGNARIGFVTSPASAVCRKSGREIACKLIGDTSSENLSGVRYGRRRR